MPWNREEDVKKAQQDYTNMSEEPVMYSAFTVAELDTALLAKLQMKKSPGPDKITNEMLLHLGPATTTTTKKETPTAEQRQLESRNCATDMEGSHHSACAHEGERQDKG